MGAQILLSFFFILPAHIIYYIFKIHYIGANIRAYNSAYMFCCIQTLIQTDIVCIWQTNSFVGIVLKICDNIWFQFIFTNVY